MDVPPLKLSPSKVSKYRDCPTALWWNVVCGLREPQSKAAKEGEYIHKLAENYMIKGEMPYKNGRLERAFQALLPLLPQERLRASEVEMWFELQFLGWPIMRGRMDYLISPIRIKGCPPEDTPIDRVPPEYWLEINDIKTTSDLKYARSAEDLETDPQSIIYSMYYLQRWPWVRFRLPYVRRNPPHYTKEVKIEWSRPRIIDGFLRLYNETIRDMIRVYNSEFHEVEKKIHNCWKYGGCGYMDYCAAQGVAVFSGKGG